MGFTHPTVAAASGQGMAGGISGGGWPVGSGGRGWWAGWGLWGGFGHSFAVGRYGWMCAPWLVRKR